MTPGHQHLEHGRRAPGYVHSPRVQCLGFEWSVLTNDPVLLDWVTSLYESCLNRKPGPASHVFTLCRHTTSDSTSVSLYRDGGAILQRVPADLAMAQLVWEVNRGVVEEAGNRLLLHAAAAERDGHVVFLAGPEGSGKSTLVTALVRSGLRYVTDETVAIEVPSATITAYPKPIGLHRDSPRSLRELWQAVPRALETELEQLLVPAQAIRDTSVADPGGIGRLLVFVAYRPAAGHGGSVDVPGRGRRRTR
jgi:hypothetical protein